METLKFFPSGKDRKEEVEQSKKNIAGFKKEGKEIIQDGYYNALDSDLEKGFANFSFTFETVVPGTYDSMRHYIEQKLKERKSEAIGIEFGGVGQNLFRGFSSGFFKKSFGITLVDHRTENEIKEDEEYRDKNKKFNHEIIGADILSHDLYELLREKLDNDKVDLIIERMIKGLEFMPEEPYELSKILQIWYKLLRENGIMFVQVPVVFNNLLEKWADLLQKDYKNSIEFRHFLGKKDTGLDHHSTFLLRKLNSAPAELPFINPRIIKNTEKYFKSSNEWW